MQPESATGNAALQGAELLGRFAAFRALPAEVLAGWWPQFEAQDLPLGTPIQLYGGDEPRSLWFTDGVIRITGADPLHQDRACTLLLRTAPLVLGALPLHPESPTLRYSISTPGPAFALSASALQRFCLEQPSLAAWLRAQLEPEALPALLRQIPPELIPAEPRALRQFCGQLIQQARLVDAPLEQLPDLITSDRRWFVLRALTPQQPLPLALPLEALLPQLTALPPQLPLRLVGLPLNLIGGPAAHPGRPLPSPASPQVVEASSPLQAPPADLWALPPGPIVPVAGAAAALSDQAAEQLTGGALAAPPARGLPLPSAPGSLHAQLELDPEEVNAAAPFRFYSSQVGPIPEALACFRMLARQLNLPIKPDVLQRVLEEQAGRGDGTVPLQLCAAIAESLGLQTQLVGVPLALIPRLETPALVELAPTELCVAFAASEAGLVLGRPRSQIEELSAEQLAPLAAEDGNLPVLLLRVTERTPQKRFGLAWFLPAIRKHRRQLIEVLVASLFVQLFQLMNPLIVQQIVDKVIGQNGMSTLPVLATLLVSFSIFENVLTAVRTNLFIETTNRIDLSLGEQVIDHLLRLPLNYFDRRPVGELSSRLAELEQIRSFLTGTALTVVLDSVFSVIYIIVMLVYSWVLTIVALLVAPLLALITISTSPVIRRQLREKAQLNARTQNHLVEVLSGIQTVKAQNFELKARWRWKERYAGYVAESFRNAVTSTTANGLTQFLNQASTLSVLCVGAYLVLQGQLTLGQLIAFRIIAGYVTGPLLRLSNLYQNFQQTALSLERLADIVDTPQESTEADRINIPMPSISGTITYDNVSFRFGQEGPLQLSQVSLEIPAGEFVAIVGQSGSGKSTLTKLLPRLYPPLSGRILVDQYDIAKVELYSLRRQIGIVPQDSLLFEGSVQDNIALTNPEATSEEIIAAARVACAHDFIMDLPSGYSSPVGERGSGLSGGQRQRIAIARTVLQNPRMLIMDEATSALDYDTERRVSLNLMEHFRGRTVLFITHRLSSIKHADRIVLMHQGQLEEQGTHEELMAMKGRYYALYRQQEAGGQQ